MVSDETIVGEIIDQLSKGCEMFGLPVSIGKVWGILYFKGEMTQDELKKAAGCSLSSVSQALNMLEKVGMVYSSRKEGRKKIYSAESSIQKVKRKQMDNALRFYVEPMSDLLNSRINEVSNKELKAKMNDFKSLFSKMEFFIKLMVKTPFGK